MSTYVNAPIHDLFIRIKNSYMARRETLDNIVYSKYKFEVLKLLKKHNFIIDFEKYEFENKSFIRIILKKVVNKILDIPVIKFYSKPSRRWYVPYTDLKKVAGGKGIGIISTNLGLLASYEAKAKKVGGEYLAEIY